MKRSQNWNPKWKPHYKRNKIKNIGNTTLTICRVVPPNLAHIYNLSEWLLTDRYINTLPANKNLQDLLNKRREDLYKNYLLNN